MRSTCTRYSLLLSDIACALETLLKAHLTQFEPSASFLRKLRSDLDFLSKNKNKTSTIFVNRINKMTSFELGKEIEKNVFRLVTSVGQKKKSEFPWGTRVEPLSSNALPLSHRDSVVRETYYEVHVWHSSCILLGSAMSIASCL